MTQLDKLSSDDPKKKGLNLYLYLQSKPIAEVDTSVGHIYLFPLRVRDIANFEELESGDEISQIKAFLPYISSLTKEFDDKSKRVPLGVEIVDRLSNEEIEQIAEAYVQANEWPTVNDSSQECKSNERKVDEMATTHLIQLMKKTIEANHLVHNKLHDKMFSSTQSHFDRVRNSALSLGSTLSEYKKFITSAKPVSSEFKAIRTDHLDAMNDLMAQQARKQAENHQEEMELTRLIGEMTAESASMLKELVESATLLMERYDERSQESEHSMKKQISIAVWSVGITAAIAFVALIMSGFAYFQDRDNLASDDIWKAKLLTSIEQGNQQYSFIERENLILQERVKLLDERIRDLEETQLSTAEVPISSNSRK